MKPINNRIEEIKNNGYPLDFGIVFETAFENYKKIALYAGLMLLVFSVLLSIIVMTGIISYVGVENLEAFGEKAKYYSTLKTMPLEFSLRLNACIILFTVIINPFMAGFLKMADCGEKGEEFHVSTMFTYYKSPYFFNICIAILLTTLTSTGLSVLMEYQGLSIVGTLISLLISFLTFLTVPLIVFGKLNAIEAIKSSAVIVMKQPLPLIALIFISGIGAALGIFGFCIGIFFTMPFVYSMNYAVYKAIIGIDDTSEIDK